MEQILIFLHLGEYLRYLAVPVGLVQLQQLVNSVLEEYSFQRAGVPLVFKLGKLDAKFLKEDVPCVVGTVFENVFYRHECRLVVLYDTGVWRDVIFTVRECVERVYGLVRRHVARKMNEDIDLVRGHVLYFLDFYLAAFLRFQDGLYKVLRVFAIWSLGDGDGAFVDFLDAGPHFHRAASPSVHIFAAVSKASGGEIREQLVVLSLHDIDGGIEKFVEVVRKNLGCESDTDALGALSQQKREPHRKLRRLHVPSVVGSHPMGDFRVEHHFLGEFAQSRLDITWRRIRISGKDVSPVSLAVYRETFLPELDQCS